MADTGKKDRKPRKRPYTIEEYAQALKGAQGFMSAAAQTLGVSRAAVTQRVKGSKKLQAIVSESKEFVKDVAESKLFVAIQAGEAWALRYFLNNQAKDRGYGQKWWDDGSGGQGEPITEVAWSEKPPKPGEEEAPKVDLASLGVEGKLTPEDLGLSGKGDTGNGNRVNGKT